MPLFPGYNYLGPSPERAGWRNGPPVNEIDRIAMAHDYGYFKLKKMGRSPYTQWNEYDEIALNQWKRLLNRNWSFKDRIALQSAIKVFNAKRNLAVQDYGNHGHTIYNDLWNRGYNEVAGSLPNNKTESIANFKHVSFIRQVGERLKRLNEPEIADLLPNKKTRLDAYEGLEVDMETNTPTSDAPKMAVDSKKKIKYRQIDVEKWSYTIYSWAKEPFLYIEYPSDLKIGVVI